jgi:hypothetical protein
MFDAIAYFFAYWSRRGPRPATEVAFWAEVFNVWPTIGYLLVGIFQLVRTLSIVDSATSLGMLNTELDKLNKLAMTAYLAFDAGYVIDSVLYFYVWFCDAEDSLRDTTAVVEATGSKKNVNSKNKDQIQRPFPDPSLDGPEDFSE